MSNSALKKLSIEHLRGCIKPFSLSFDKGKKLTVIYGENGSGKTTICDAFEFLGKGKVGSLDNRGLGVGTQKYWHSVGKRASDVVVGLETGSLTCTGKIGKGGVITSSRRKRLHRSGVAGVTGRYGGKELSAWVQYLISYSALVSLYGTDHDTSRSC